MYLLNNFILPFLFPHSRRFWALLFIGFLFYEACGLYFQYVLNLNPCIECVYERACFMFFGIAAIIGMIAPRHFFMRSAASITWLASSIWGLIISIEHRKFEINYDNPFADSCSLHANFPSWFKLDEWLPNVFAPTGICGDAKWSFLSLTMVQWVEIIFICNLIVAAVWFITSFISYRKYAAVIGLPVRI